jgi:hypothetical protein
MGRLSFSSREKIAVMHRAVSKKYSLFKISGLPFVVEQMVWREHPIIKRAGNQRSSGPH